MSIGESLAIGVGTSVLAGVIFSKAKDVWGNENFKSALKHFNDSSNELPKRAEAYFKAIEIILDDTIPLAKHNKRMLIYLNSSLVSAISKIYEEVKETSQEKKKSKTIVGVMLQEKMAKSTSAQIILITSFSVNLILSMIGIAPFSNFLLVLSSLLILAIHVDQKLIDYRIKNGWYGRNEFEAKEIIKFIIYHSNKNDFNDSGGLKRVIPIPEISAETEKHHSFLPG